MSVGQGDVKGDQVANADAAIDAFLMEEEGLLEKLQNHVKNGEKKEIEIIMYNEKNHPELRTLGWDIVPCIAEYLTEKYKEENILIIESCEYILLKLSEISNPKEFLLALLELEDIHDEDVRFLAVLPAVQTCLLGITGKRGHSVAIALETIYKHVESLPSPSDHDLEGTESKLVHLDSDVIRINDVLEAVLEFLTPLVKQVSIRTVDSEQRQKESKQVAELTKFLIKIFEYPCCILDLGYDVEIEKSVKSFSRLNAERAMNLMAHLQGNYVKCVDRFMLENADINYKQMKHRKKREVKEQALLNEASDRLDLDDIEDDELDVEEKTSELGISVLIYLAYSESLGMYVQPQVFTPQYMFSFTSAFICLLLSKSKRLSIEKGVSLLGQVLEKLEPHSLNGDLMDSAKVKGLLQTQVNIMVSNQYKEIRQKTVKLLPILLSKFDMLGKHRFIYFLMKKCTHSGVIGYVMQMLKNLIDENLKATEPSELFVGSQLEKLLKLAFCLPNGATTDLLEQSDRIMAALNLLRYITIRDAPGDNVTGVWNYMSRIEKDFLEVLRTGVNMSRAHYKMELDKVKSGDHRRDPDEPEISVNVGGQDLAMMDKGQQEQLMNMALHTFDMMESVVSRVTELADQQRKGVL